MWGKEEEGQATEDFLRFSPWMKISSSQRWADFHGLLRKPHSSDWQSTRRPLSNFLL